MHTEIDDGKKHKKQSAKKIEVRIGDYRIPGYRATNVYVDALKYIGLARVAALNLSIGQNQIVSTTPPTPNRGFRKCGDWYVLTHCSTREKKALIEQVADSLNVDLTVRLIEPEDALTWLLE